VLAFDLAGIWDRRHEDELATRRQIRLKARQRTVDEEFERCLEAARQHRRKGMEMLGNPRKHIGHEVELVNNAAGRLDVVF
jgi:hypothetical protein